MRAHVSRFADAKSLPITVAERLGDGAPGSRGDAVTAAKQFVAHSIKAHDGAEMVDWAKTQAAVVVKEGSGYAAYAATGPLGTPTWAVENGERVPGAIQFANKFRATDRRVADVVTGAGELQRIHMSPGLAEGLKGAAWLGGLAALGVGAYALTQVGTE